MPKEQPCLNEASTSSKNAKDKSNSSTAMQAVHESKHTDSSKGRSSHSSSEKDSGYSDTGSDWQLTSAKNQGNQKQSRETAEKSPPKQNEEPKNNNKGNAIVASPTQQLQSFHIIKNMVHEQPRIVQKNGQLLWSSGNRPNVPGTNPVILLQPPNMLFPTSLQLPKAGICKSNVTGKKINAAYLPILNSYPRIAPNLHKKPPDKTAPSDESLNQSKRVCTEHKSQNLQVSGSLQEQHVHKQPKALSSNTQPTSSGATVLTSQPTSTASSLSATELNKNSIINTRHQRFVNTIEILKQSGLLDITTRTKELIRQSSATNRDMAQLKQHSELLCQLSANSSTNHSPNNMAAWQNLHRIMAESGCYPGLKNLQVPDQELSGNETSVNNDSGQLVTSDIPSVPHTSHVNPVPQLSQMERRGTNISNNCKLENDSDTSPDSSTD